MSAPKRSTADRDVQISTLLAEAAHLGNGWGFIHEAKDQLGMLSAVSAYAATVPSARDAGRVHPGAR